MLDVECTAMWSDIRTNGVSLWVGLPSMTKWLWKPNDTWCLPLWWERM